jgi:Raf kinase inhibitor-like YbhB/YbcL family protein
LTSSAFANTATLPMRHTCDGEGVSPPLAITGAPEGTVSLALTVQDPDVPTPAAPTRTIDHWVVWNVSVGGAVFPEGSVPIGASEGDSDFGHGWLAPCPPPASPSHRYVFMAYALDTRLELADNATADEMEGAMQGHVLGTTALTAKYGRPVPPTTAPTR